MKKVYLTIGVILAGGMAASLLIIPRPQEVALMQFKDKDFENARQAYEAQLKKGTLTSELVARMVDLYLQEGRIDDAIALVEKYLAGHPDDVEARRKLATLYQYAQRAEDFQRNLEEIVRITPNAEDFVTLADIYNFNAQYDRQIETLRAILKLETGARPVHYTDLASLLANQELPGEAIEVLLALRQRFPDAYSFHEQELLVSLMLDAGRKEDATEAVNAWKETGTPGEMARLISLLYDRGAVQEAETILAGYGSKIAADPALLAEQVALWLNQGKQELTLHTLEALHSQGVMTPDIESKYMPLATELRGSLATFYVEKGEYEKALALLRERQGPLSEDAEQAYLTALAKRAGNHPDDREELARYASDQLSGNLPDERKEALVYALIDAGKTEAAMPALRELALTGQGNWAMIYAEQLDAQGRKKEAREFWIKLAGMPQATAAQKRQIAFALLEYGDRDGARFLFAGLAEHASAESNDVKELLYLWGPRPGPNKMKWIARRLVSARGKEQAAWAAIYADRATDKALLALAEKEPAVLRHAPMAQAYVDTLAHEGRLAQARAGVFAQAEQGNTPLLRAYARAARGQEGGDTLAFEAYEKLGVLVAGDAEALREAALLTYAQGRYTAARDMLARYLAAVEEGSLNDTDAYQASLAYAELLGRDRRQEEARTYYQQALMRIEGKKLEDAAALSARALCLIRLGRTEEGMAAFEEAATRYPGEDSLRTDHINALIDQKHYAQARAQLSGEAAAAQAPPPFTLGKGPVTTYTVSAQGDEVLLTVPPAATAAQATAINEAGLPWLAYVSEGYDNLLVAAREGYTLQAQPAGNGDVTLTATPAAVRKNTLRYELLAARIELETGEQYAAAQRLTAQLPQHPQNTQLIGALATAEHGAGNWWRAGRLLDGALLAAPGNEDLAELSRDIHREHGPYAQLGFDWFKRGSSHEYITSFAGDVQSGPWEARLYLDANRVLARNVRRADGRTGNFNDYVERAEVTLTRHEESGRYLRGSLFANNDTPGAGVALGFLHPYGVAEITAEFHRPYWEFIEGTIDDATRDRIAIENIYQSIGRLTLTGNVGFNRYNVRQDDGVNTTVSGLVSIWYLLREAQPSLSVSYGIDAEYGLHKTFRLDALGNPYKPFPFESRQVHFGAMTAGWQWGQTTQGELTFGYGYDLLGDRGPAVEGRLVHNLTAALDAELHAAYGFSSVSQGDNYARAGGTLRWRF